MHEFDGKALIFMIFNNDAIKKELSGLLDTSRQARRHHLIFLLKIALAFFASPALLSELDLSAEQLMLLPLSIYLMYSHKDMLLKFTTQMAI